MVRYRTLLLVTFVAFAAGCTRTAINRDTIYHVSSVRALQESVFDGEVTYGQLKRYANLGLGAVDRVDGELALVDGTCYQIKADGSVHVLKDSEKTPYAVATRFEPDLALQIEGEIEYEQVQKRLDQELGNLNLPWALRIEGDFSYMRARSIPGQTRPYPRLIELIKKQPIFEFQNVSGVMMGFRMPAYVDGLSAPGYHLHLVTSDLKGGGHVLAFRARKLKVQADLCSSVHVVLPRSDDFARAKFDEEAKKELQTIMGRGAKK